MEGNLEINEEENYILISVNPKIYPLDVIYSAAYTFIDNCYILMDGDPKEEIIIEIRPKEKQDLKEIGRKFNNELINYGTYAMQSVKNASLREAILKRVLLTNDQEQPCSSDEKTEIPWSDPENIAEPWKNGKSKNRPEQK